MYLTEFDIKGIKCFEDLRLQFREVDGDYSGWNVILGGNATGKSTLLQAMALTCVGSVLGQKLVSNIESWVRRTGSKRPNEPGVIRSQIAKGPHDKATGQPRKKPYTASFAITSSDEVEIDGDVYSTPQIVMLKESDERGLNTSLYAEKRWRWFSSGYGPFRRLTGMGGEDENRLVFGSGRGRRFATLFREGAALTDCVAWLGAVYNRSNDPKREKDHPALKQDLEVIKDVINGLLPGRVRIKAIYSDHVYFHTPTSDRVEAANLSDGYRSFLALAIDLLRHIYESTPTFGKFVEKANGCVRITMDGVVFIDEVDAHLHPTWQREIGFWLQRTFPNIQFIVTTHSPFVAQAASDGGLFVLRQSANENSVSVHQPIDSVRGWRVDQILTSPLFNLDGTRDRETEDLMRAHTELVAKREWDELTPKERKELAALEASLADRLTAPGETAEDRDRQTAMSEFVQRTLKSLK